MEKCTVFSGEGVVSGHCVRHPGWRTQLADGVPTDGDAAASMMAKHELVRAHAEL